MAQINQIDNFASITFDGKAIKSNTVTTLLLLAPTIVKAVDKATASIGDILTYTITITNPSLSAIQNLPFTDTIPVGCTYRTESFKVNGVTVTPIIARDTLSYVIPTIAAGGSAVISFQVLVNGGTN